MTKGVVGKPVAVTALEVRLRNAKATIAKQKARIKELEQGLKDVRGSTVAAINALNAAVKARMQHADAQIMSVRRANRRGDARRPPHAPESGK
jgi:hypothetical protein